MKKFDDRTSRALLRELRRNGRISWQALGRAVHLSGQAVAERVRQLQEAGLIRGFTLRETRARHFIAVKMQTGGFPSLKTGYRAGKTWRAPIKPAATAAIKSSMPAMIRRSWNGFSMNYCTTAATSIRRVK